LIVVIVDEAIKHTASLLDRLVVLFVA